MRIVRFPKFKRSLRVAREQAARQNGQALARAIERLEDRERDLLHAFVRRFDPHPESEPGPEPEPDL